MSVSTINRLVDSSYGIINYLLKCVRYPEHPMLWVYSALGALCHSSGIVTGAAVNKSEAKRRAVESYLTLYCNNNLSDRDKLELIELSTGSKESLTMEKFDQSGLTEGLGAGEGLEETLQIAIINAFTNITYKMLQEERLKLQEINLENSSELPALYNQYIKGTGNFDLYSISHSPLPTVVGTTRLHDGRLSVQVAAAKDYESACKNCFIELGKSKILSSHLSDIDFSNHLTLKQIETQIVKSDNTALTAMSLDALPFEVSYCDITSADIKEVGLYVVKAFISEKNYCEVLCNE